jgi:hypothetical protein
MEDQQPKPVAPTLDEQIAIEEKKLADVVNKPQPPTQPAIPAQSTPKKPAAKKPAASSKKVASWEKSMNLHSNRELTETIYKTALKESRDSSTNPDLEHCRLDYVRIFRRKRRRRTDSSSRSSKIDIFYSKTISHCMGTFHVVRFCLF